MATILLGPCAVKKPRLRRKYQLSGLSFDEAELRVFAGSDLFEPQLEYAPAFFDDNGTCCQHVGDSELTSSADRLSQRRQIKIDRLEMVPRLGNLPQIGDRAFGVLPH